MLGTETPLIWSVCDDNSEQIKIGSVWLFLAYGSLANFTAPWTFLTVGQCETIVSQCWTSHSELFGY